MSNHSQFSAIVLENAGQDCWNGCNQQQGKCSWCGAEGFFCQKGWQGNECDGSFGGESMHACELKPEGNVVGQ